MEKYLQQDSEFVCSSGAAADKTKFYALVPLSVDCPMWKRMYDRYDLNGVHGAHGDVDPMNINFNLTEKGVNNGIKGYQKGDVEKEWSLPILTGGDNSFENRIAPLQEDPGGIGGDIIQEILIEIVSPVTLEDGSIIEKTRLYQTRTDSMGAFGTAHSEDETEYDWSLKVINKPKVWYNFNPTALRSSHEIKLNTTDTLTYDEVSGNISGTIEIPELANNKAKMSLSLIDPKDRGNVVMFGSNAVVESSDGIFSINMKAPVVEDTEKVQLSAVVSGVNVFFAEYVVNEVPVAYINVSKIQPQTASLKFEIEDNSNVIDNNQITYEIKDKANHQVITKGNMKARTLKPVALEGLEPNKNYIVEIKYNSTLLGEETFKTAADTTPPVLNMNADRLEVAKDTVVDYDYHINHNGLKAIDDIDGELTQKHFTIERVDTSIVGEHTQMITVMDNSGNKTSSQLTIMVK